MAGAGAKVTHVDASKKAVGWARENGGSGGRGHPLDLRGRPQVGGAGSPPRGAATTGSSSIPRNMGAGPAGEVWRLNEDLPGLIEGCAALLSADARFLLLNAYSERLSGLALAGLLAEALQGRGGQVEWGELALMEQGGARGVGLSFFARWTA